MPTVVASFTTIATAIPAIAAIAAIAATPIIPACATARATRTTTYTAEKSPAGTQQALDGPCATTANVPPYASAQQPFL